ncbi:MAG: O-antigen ligase family protein [Candidatus Woesebacteria bacterium]|jgi:hypothetical protein
MKLLNLNKKIFSKLTNVFLFLIIFSAPLNLFFKLNETAAYVHGLLIDYLIPKIYLVDIFIICFLIVYLIKLLINKTNLISFSKKTFTPNKYYLLFFSILTIFIIRQAFTKNIIASTYFLLRLIEIVSFSCILIKEKKELNKNLIFFAVIITLLFQSSLAIYQFHQQRSLFRYQILGETKLSNYYGISKGSFNGEEKILPYATTAHPNVLGGFLLIYIMIAFSCLKNNQDRRAILWTMTLIPSLYILYLSQSISATLTFILFLISIVTTTLIRKFKLQKLKKTILKYLLNPATFVLILSIMPFLVYQLAKKNTDNLSFTRRDYLNQAAWQIFLDKAWWGTGLNNFTLHLENYLPRQAKNFIQPVHHLGLLILSETGLLGIILIFSSIQLIKIKNKNKYLNKLLILLPIIGLDHYLITQTVGLISLSLFFLI